MNKNSLAAALLLCCSALMSCSASAADTTPYGLIFASGTATDNVSGNFGGYTYTQGTQYNVSVAFFRPPTVPATSAYSGVLDPSAAPFFPGSITVTKPDGTVVLNAQNVAPLFIWFPNFGGTGPIGAVIAAPITFNGNSCWMTGAIYPPGVNGIAWDTNTYVQVSIYHGNVGDFALNATFSGFEFVDP